MGRPRRRRRNSRNSRWSSVRIAKIRGSGSSQTRSYRTGGLSITGVSPTGRVANARPAIRATVRDEGASLSKRDIKLYLDGSEKTRFHYDQASGRLDYHVGVPLSSGTHEVRVEAQSESGGSPARFGGTARKRWTFTVIR